MTKAYSMLKKGYYEVAVQMYKKLQLKYSDNLNISFALAYSYHKLSQLEKAKGIYYKLISSNYKNKDKVINNILDIITSQPSVDALYILNKLSIENSNNSWFSFE